MAFKLMYLRFDGHCAACNTPTPASTRAWWHEVRKEVTCTRCRPVEFEPATASALLQMLPPRRPSSIGVVGASAVAMYEKERANQQPVDPHDDTDGTPLRNTASWNASGSDERHLGEFLDDTFAGSAVVLHDRTVVDEPQLGTIDHVIIASSGVWVVDEKNFNGSVDVRTEGVWKFKTNDLYVGCRNQRKFVDAMGWQAAAVQSLVEPMDMGIVPVHSALCFVGSAWSRHSDAAVIDGVLVLSPDKLRSVASLPGWVDPDAINAIASQLSSGLPRRRQADVPPPPNSTAVIGPVVPPLTSLSAHLYDGAPPHR